MSERTTERPLYMLSLLLCLAGRGAAAACRLPAAWAACSRCSLPPTASPSCCCSPLPCLAPCSAADGVLLTGLTAFVTPRQVLEVCGCSAGTGSVPGQPNATVAPTFGPAPTQAASAMASASGGGSASASASASAGAAPAAVVSQVLSYPQATPALPAGAPPPGGNGASAPPQGR